MLLYILSTLGKYFKARITAKMGWIQVIESKCRGILKKPTHTYSPLPTKSTWIGFYAVGI